MKTHYFRKSILALSLVLMGWMPQAMAASGGDMRFSIAGAGNYGLNSTAAGPGTAKGGIGYGGGVLLGFGSKVGFEVGGIYVQRKIEISGTGILDGTITWKAIHIPARLQFRLGSRVLLNLGGYYDHSMEDGGESDYGATGGLRFNFPMGKNLFFLDFAYNQALKDTTSEKYKEVLGLVGITF